MMVENIIDLCILSLMWMLPFMAMVILHIIFEKTGLLDILASVIWGEEDTDESTNGG